MPSITEDLNAPIKALLVGKSGVGKTGSLASLVAAGYNLRIIDTDKGVRRLRSLLMDKEHYAYGKIIDERGIDLTQAVRYISIDTSMKLRTIERRIGENKTSRETLLAPTDALAWPRVLEIMMDWKDGDVNLGPVSSWGLQDILVIDSFSTLAKAVYYFSQALNGRLGARDQGRDYQRDVGEAQSQLTRLLEMVYDTGIGCHVLILSHITWVDESQGVAKMPAAGQMSNEKDAMISLSAPDGYPSAIGRALSPQMGKYFNDMYIVRSEGSGQSIRHYISTVSQDGVAAKHSVWLKPEYSITTGLAEIFATLRDLPQPQDLLDAAKPKQSLPQAPSGNPTSSLRPK